MHPLAPTGADSSWIRHVEATTWRPCNPAGPVRKLGLQGVRQGVPGHGYDVRSLHRLGRQATSWGLETSVLSKADEGRMTFSTAVGRALRERLQAVSRSYTLNAGRRKCVS